MNTVIKLTFSDGTVVKAIDEHGFFDATINNFAFINGNNAYGYIGHEFVKETADSYTTVTLVDCEITNEYVRSYSILSVFYCNFTTEGMFSLTSPMDDDNFYMPFEIDHNMKYDEEKMAEDIAKYGLYEYSDLADIMTYETFVALNAQYLKVSVGKGLVTLEEIEAILNIQNVQ
jgi:hypothetical protein